MKVRANINCTGIGYENFKKDEVRSLSKKLAEKLISFGFVKAIDKNTQKK